MPRPKKLDTVMNKYDLPELTDELAARRRTGATFRDLESYANHQIVRAVAREAPVSAADVSAVLRGDGTPGQESEVKAALARAGWSLEELASDQVTHETVRSYLYDEYELEPDREGESEEATVGGALATSEWALRRAEGIIERSLQRLRSSGAIDYDDDRLRVDLDVNVSYGTEDGTRGFGLREFITFAATDPDGEATRDRTDA